MIEIRPVENEADLEAWAGLKTAVVPDEPVTAEQLRNSPGRDRLLLLAELDGELAACGLGARSDDPNRGFVIARVLPHARRRGVGTALLQPLVAHVEELGLATAGTRVDARDEGSRAFAERFGFREWHRDVQQVKQIGDERPPEPLPGIEVVTIAEQPELLERAYGLAGEAFADLAIDATLDVSLEQWLAEEATRPDGSFVALAGDEIVGYAGLLQLGDRSDEAEHGLSAVRRGWRRRGIATHLKRRQLAWAAANGVRELVTYTQTGNEGMQAVNEQLGYEIRTEHVALRAALPLSLP